MTARAAAAVPVVIALAGTAPAAAPAAKCTRAVGHDASVPVWEAVNGFVLGSRPATVEEIDAYVAAVDRASPRVRIGVAGRSVQGRPLVYALVSDARNLERRRLAALSRALRARSARRGPAVVWIAGGVHGDEPSGSDADMRILYDLAARTDCENRSRVRRVLTVILPLQNPDGRVAATRDNAAGFDLNRDWFAATQPESAARLALIRRFPPVLLADQHEQDGVDFTLPPNADPVHHEIGREALAAINDVAAPAVRRALAARGVPHTSGGPYDLFFMGYADTASTTMAGAGGMTFEQGRDAPLADRVARHVLAADALLDAAAAHRPRLLRAWTRQWRAAQRQGAAGRLQPNLTLHPAARVTFPVPRAPVHAYALRADRHRADVAALVRRLRAAGVVVRRLGSPWRAPSFDPYGAAANGTATLRAGTFVVPMRQPAKHWVQAMLGEDSYVPFPYFYDVSAWSGPLLMGVFGGAVRSRVPSRLLRPVAAVHLRGAMPRAGAPAYGFAGDSEAALGLATTLLARGAAVSRVPHTGRLVVTGGADHASLTSLATARAVPLRALGAVPAGTMALRAPRIALLDASTTRSGHWSRYVVERRLGLAATVLRAPEIASGRLGHEQFTALIVPDGSGQAIGPAELSQIQAWVRGGGTFVGFRASGVAVARAAGLTGATVRTSPPALRIPGALLGVDWDATDPVGWGTGGPGFVFNDGDPVLEPGGAHVVARYPGGARFFASGYAEGTESLHGTAAATHERVGSGHVVLFAFEPAFRGYAEGTQRVLANALLIPAAGGGTDTRRARPVDESWLAAVARSSRPSLVTVAAADERRLLDAAADAGVSSTSGVQRDLGTVTLAVPSRMDRGTRDTAWMRRLLGALERANVTPLYADF